MTETNPFASRTGLTSNQVAAIGEALVAIELIKASAGKLSPSKPLTDDYGIDLVL